MSILCDNAIEASVEASQPHVSIAFLKNGEQETFIIENSIKEESIDISEIFSFGASSKGGGERCWSLYCHEDCGKSSQYQSQYHLSKSSLSSGFNGSLVAGCSLENL